MLIKLKSISKTFGTRTILDRVSFSIEKGDKIALVGTNGSGKSTLLNILAGITEPEGGEIERSKDLKVAYVQQEIAPNSIHSKTVNDFLENPLLNVPNEAEESYNLGESTTYPHEVKEILNGLGFHINLNIGIEKLSGGERTKIMLAKAILEKPDLLLMDEPTNNLDIPALIWLEEFIKKSQLTFLIVSHDITFLDNTVNKILHIDEKSGKFETSKGLYSNFLNSLKIEKDKILDQYTAQREEISRLKSSAHNIREEALKAGRAEASDTDKLLLNFKRDRSTKGMSKANKLDKKAEDMNIIERPPKDNPFIIALDPSRTPHQEIIRLEKAEIHKTEKKIFGPFDLSINYGDRICFVGGNGSGKTTLLSLLTGTDLPDIGIATIGKGLIIGNLMQHHEHIPQDEILISYIQKESAIEENEAFNILEHFNLPKDHAREKIAGLSPGERARLSLAIFSSRHVNTLVLDEPTNHLDQDALEALQNVLKEYEGIVLIASHDRTFIKETRIDVFYELKDGKLFKIGSFEKYLEQAEKDASRMLSMMKKY